MGGTVAEESVRACVRDAGDGTGQYTEVGSQVNVCWASAAFTSR